MDGESGVSAALSEAQYGIACHFVHKPDTATAHDTSLVIEADAGTNIDILRFLYLQIDKARGAFTEADGKLLQSTLARLVADRAVERVIDEQELHHTFAAFFHQLASGADAHIFTHRVGTSDHGTWHPTDGFVSHIIALRLLSGSRAGGHAHLNKAHAAIAWRGKFRMITIVRHFYLNRTTGLDHPGAARKLVPNAVDLHVDHAFFGSEVFGKFDFRRGRSGVAHGKIVWT